MNKVFNVAPLGEASQSSISKWSRKDDAQRAVMNLDVDFAFHTDPFLDENAWWMLELDNEYQIESIQVHNRRNIKYQSISSNIKVLASCDALNWETVYSGRYLFGTEPIGTHLNISINTNSRFRYIKIINLEKKHLHLRSVKVFSKYIVNDNNRLCFIANRFDGFGERLKAILKAMVAAKATGCDFAFNWPELGPKNKHSTFHSVVAKELVFSKSFIDEHYITKGRMDTLQQVPLAKLILPLGKSEDNKICLIESSPIEPYIGQGVTNDLYINAFKNIGFSERYNYIMSLVDSHLHNQKGIAFHLRAGDIVYGAYKDDDRFSGKVIPFAIVVDMIQNIHNDQDLYIFGQDQVQLDYLKSKFNVMLAHELCSSYDLNIAETAFFEIYLMSKLSEVYAYPSAFSYVPTMIGNCKIVNPSSLYDKSTMLDIIEKSLAETLPFFTPHHRAHSIVYILKNYYDNLSLSEKLTYIEKAKSLDSSNLFFKILHVAFLYENNQKVCADKLLEDLLLTDSKELKQYLKKIHFYRSFLGGKAMNELYGHSEISAFANLFVFIVLFFARENLSKVYKLKLSAKGIKVNATNEKVSITFSDGKVLSF